MKKIAFVFAAILGLTFIGATSPAHAVEAVLQVAISGSTRTVSRAELAEKLQSATLTVYNPAYKSVMTYQGFWLDQILAMMHIKLDRQDVVFQSSDGYGTSLSSSEVGRRQWLVAYNEPHGWTPLPGHRPPVFPGPWYVIGKDPESFKQTPWPYQVTTIKIRGDW